jgi:tRNA (guanine26-N2/guanine27-N2)-dimethyltransferase
MYEEGKARIKYHDVAFLNPTARFLRDLSVSLVKMEANRNSAVLDATAATGIRGIRYALETKAKDVTMLDINERAYKEAKMNTAFNKVKGRVLHQSIQEFANTTDERFDFIDYDPFGGVSPSIFDLLKIAKSGGWLMFTATDAAVLCGAHQKACLKLYDAVPLHNELCHEVGLRILIGYVARLASQFDYGIEVKLALVYAHYMRVFVKLEHGSDDATRSLSELGYVYYCNSCGSRYWRKGAVPKPDIRCCAKAHSNTLISGKMWLGNLYDKELVSRLITELEGKTEKAGLKALSLINDEPDIPLYYSIPVTTKKMGVPGVSPLIILDMLKKEGFVASRPHFDMSSIKTDAKIEDITRLVQKALRG